MIEHIWCEAARCAHNSSGADGNVDDFQVFVCILPLYASVVDEKLMLFKCL